MAKSKDKHILNEKLEEVASILQFLEKEFGLDYILSIVSKDPYLPKNTKIEEIYTNTDIKEDSLNFLTYEISKKIVRKRWLEELLFKGITLVECINNGDKPIEVLPQNWIQVGQIYYVGETRFDTPGMIYYQLKSYDGKLCPILISSKKFRKLHLDNLWN